MTAMSPQLAYWEPEDRQFWAREGAQVARRNLLVSIPALMLSFAVWMVWSVVVVQLPHIGFRFTPNQLFWLAALPGLAGGTLRLFFSFMVPMFGGRTWTALSTVALLIPAIGLGVAVQDPATSYPTFLGLALLAGIGGGNFASSMANISFFFPIERKGTALGWNAGLGNLGVGLAQLVVPLAIGAAAFGALGGAPQTWSDGAGTREVWLQNAGYVWVPLIVVAALAAWFAMDDLAPMRASVADQAVIFVRRHTWLMAWLYLGTFGSFIGFAAGFPLVAQTEFAGVDVTWYAFVGPLLAALARPAGGVLADRYGGARVALASFIAMALVIVLLLAVCARRGRGRRLRHVPRPFLRAVRGQRRRQRGGVPDDPGGLRRRPAPGVRRSARRGGAGAARGHAGGRGRARARLGDRRVRRLLHPQGVRDGVRPDRRHHRRAVSVSGFLPVVHCPDVVVLCAAARGVAVLTAAKCAAGADNPYGDSAALRAADRQFRFTQPGSCQ